MMMKTALLFLVIVALVGVVCAVVLYGRKVAGWEQNMDPHYSPDFPVDDKVIAGIQRITLEEYGFDLQHHILEYRNDGVAHYFGEYLPMGSHRTNTKFRVGTYVGHTDEFEPLASWIVSQGFPDIADPCPQKEGYDTPVITVSMRIGQDEKSVTTCGSYDGQTSFHPIDLTQLAIEDVATRVQWHRSK